ncbi:MAG: hypothetical protein ACREOW_17645 [Thermodesulfobacteriota bacterium]
MTYFNNCEYGSYKPITDLHSSGIDEIKSRAVYKDTYSYFDVDFNIRFDSPEVQQLYRNRYKHFRINPSDRSDNYTDTYYVISKNPFYDKPLLLVDSKSERNLVEIFSKGSNRKRFKMNRVDNNGHTYYAVTDSNLNNKTAMMISNNTSIILDEELWGSYAELIIFNSILSQIPNHFILHAGVVSWKDRGIILCGDMNSGKSTLTLSLARNGFKFLSDEIAFIDLESFEVAPFPRAMGFREDTISKIPELKFLKGQKNAMSLSGDMKWTFDIEEVCPNSLGNKFKIGYLIFLDGFEEHPKLRHIPKSEALIESLRYTHTSGDDPIKHLLKVSDLVKEVECLRFVLGDRKENVKVLRNLVENHLC